MEDLLWFTDRFSRAFYQRANRRPRVDTDFCATCPFQVYANVVQWWFLCALVADCIAPTNDLFCNFATGADRDSQYAECHRYDQSAINVLLVNHFVRRLMASHADNRQGIESFQLTAQYSANGPLECFRRERHNPSLSVCGGDGKSNVSRISVDEYFPRRSWFFFF